MERYWQELVDVVLSVDCAGCGRPRSGLCDPCRQALRPRPVRRIRPTRPPPGLPPVFAAVDYADEARAVLLAHKERGALRLARPLGAVLAEVVRVAVREVSAERLSLVPVPSARRAVAARGQDATRRLAQAAARALRRAGYPAQARGVLRQRRVVTDQAGLDTPGRLANLVDALEVAPGSGGWSAGEAVVLVDDLVTTGSSLAEAARAVRHAGGEVVGAAVVAASARAVDGRRPAREIRASRVSGAGWDSARSTGR